MSIIVDVDEVSDVNQDENIYERLKKAAEEGDIERLYELIAEDPNILGDFGNVPFCETPLHVAAEKGQGHFAMEMMTLKPSFAVKLNASGFSPVHLALQNNHTRVVRGFIIIDSSLVSVKGRGRITPLHHVAQIGDAELLSVFLFAFPSSVEDLTIKCETAVHIAVKNHQIEAFKVLFGWLKREFREEILDWKDEDGNTVYHIAASTNQHEVMKLLGKTVKVRAKNLDGQTAKDILPTHTPHPFPKVSRWLQRLVFGPTITLAGYLSTKPSSIERRNNLFGQSNLNRTRQGSQITNESRTVILVVAILIVTATYQANLSPPGGFWQDDSKNPRDINGHYAGEMIMLSGNAVIFLFLNGAAFFSSLYVIMMLIVGLPMWRFLYAAIAFIGLANFASFCVTFPSTYHYIVAISGMVFVVGYPALTLIIVCLSFVAFFLNKRRRRQVDFPARYFTSPHELLC